MDQELNSTLDQIASKEDVKGVLLADEMGLCLGARGIAKSDAAANAAAIARTARELALPSLEDQDKSQYPTITLAFEHSKVVIRNEGSFTLAIFM
ncbi:hypothetical protein BDA99DRAFT_497244 [Phascolomyces articulosus]|uniref:Late endosomal/lysosomal adaptor and MAPK and MTOR activator 5 n=1 Tax=Phascolomyces articulosus TaxID=60185 RepID=A0AAD5KKE4_9FUNG|nr:hypothetical protein BDA99DRAFT_497244 [Phascolomyces articulosus]